MVFAPPMSLQRHCRLGNSQHADILTSNLGHSVWISGNLLVSFCLWDRFCHERFGSPEDGFFSEPVLPHIHRRQRLLTAIDYRLYSMEHIVVSAEPLYFVFWQFMEDKLISGISFWCCPRSVNMHKYVKPQASTSEMWTWVPYQKAQLFSFRSFDSERLKSFLRFLLLHSSGSRCLMVFLSVKSGTFLHLLLIEEYFVLVLTSTKDFNNAQKAAGEPDGKQCEAVS